MKWIVFVKKQVDGISRRSRADVKAQEHADSAIECRIARQPVALLKPKIIHRRDRDQRDQKLGFPAVEAISHQWFSLGIDALRCSIAIKLICKGRS